MVVSVATVAFEEIEGKAVDKQVQILPGNVVFNIVGLGEGGHRIARAGPLGPRRLRSGDAGLL